MTVFRLFLIIFSVICVFLAGAFASQRFEKPQAPSEPVIDVETLQAERAWYRWFFSEYAAALRYEQYKTPTLDINLLLHAREKDFIPIPKVTTHMVCPAQSNGPFTGEWIYFGARTLPLPRADGVDLYIMSYTGSAPYTYSGKAFDVLLSDKQIDKETVNIEKPFGLAQSWGDLHGFDKTNFTPHGTSTYFRPFSLGVGDVDGDGKSDFIFATWLILSSKKYAHAVEVPQSSHIAGKYVISRTDDRLILSVWNGEKLKQLESADFEEPLVENIHYEFLPISDSMFAVRTLRGLEIYRIEADALVTDQWISGLISDEVLLGSRGDFTGDGKDDIWISQTDVRTPIAERQDHVTLIDLSRLKSGENKLADLGVFTLKGSQTYSDYDGISTSMSPVAGDIDKDGKPDLSITGHRHMNEAGAMYVLFGKDIGAGQTMDITDPRTVKILGRHMSQLAPPYLHWDGTDFDKDGYDDIVVAADNDLCSGLNAGATYILSGKLITEEHSRQSALNAAR